MKVKLTARTTDPDKSTSIEIFGKVKTDRDGSLYVEEIFPSKKRALEYLMYLSKEYLNSTDFKDILSGNMMEYNGVTCYLEPQQHYIYG